jgi:Tfp pilus assembly protein PilF
MIRLIKKIGLGLCLCLALLFLANTKVNGLDKKTSFTLSHYIMGVFHEDLGDIDEAIQEYKKALKVDDENLIIHLNLASSYIKKDDTAKAIAELRLASSIDPEAVEPFALLALLYSSKNELNLAASAYEKALKNASKLQPKNIDIYKSLGLVYLQQKEFKEAENTYRLITDLSPDDAQAHFYLANVYNELKKRDLTEKELRCALELNPDYHEALNFLGYLYVEEDKNLDEAEAMIRKALEFQPHNGAYLDSLGWYYFKKGQYDEALKELQKASSLLEDPVIYDHLGDTYLKFKDTENAKINWEKSLKLSPEQEKVKEKLEKINGEI